MRPPRLRCALFPLIYPPHLLVLPATFGLHLLWQTYPHFRALYVFSVRRTKSLPATSFRFHLTMDTLVVQLYTSSLPRRVRDFHPLERAHGAQTKKRRRVLSPIASFHIILLSYFLINKDFPVISAGCSIPINSIIVGMISARHPSSFNPYAGSALIKINGTGLVVCAVNGSPVS